eukprot:1576612-Rhodomonas_salina.1
MDGGRSTAAGSYPRRTQQDLEGKGPAPVPGLVLLVGPRAEPQDRHYSWDERPDHPPLLLLHQTRVAVGRAKEARPDHRNPVPVDV